MIDESNYLTDLAPWSKDKAVELGIIEGLDIEKDHIEILITARNFYSIYESILLPCIEMILLMYSASF